MGPDLGCSAGSGEGHDVSEREAGWLLVLGVVLGVCLGMLLMAPFVCK